MRIRKATAKDVPLIEAILLEAVIWLNSIHQPLWNREDIRWDNLSKAHPLEEWYVVYEQETILATFLICDEDRTYWPECSKGASLFIHKLCVRRDYAKKGVSTFILDFFKQEAQKCGMNDCRLDCRSAKVALKRFYESQGFELVNEAEYVKGYQTSRYRYKIS